MHRHFLPTARLHQPRIELTRDESRHLQTVLRLQSGDDVELFDGAGTTVAACVAAAGHRGLELEPAAAPVRHPAPACRLVLFACVSKGRRMDWTVEKAVELGVARIVPVIAARSVVRLHDDAEADDKAGRWQRVAVETARQCGAVWLPQLDAPVPFADACTLVREHAPVFVAALAPGARPVREVLAERRSGPPPATAGWFVGPEGDFSPDELRQAVAAGAISVTLGRRVLRTETAAIWGLCVLGAEWL